VKDGRAYQIARIRHRLGQFAETVFAPLWPVNEAEAAACIGSMPEAASLEHLFRTMSHTEQRHGLLVCRRLKDQGITSFDLLAAGLLHDVGKSVYPPCLWERVAVVLLEHYLPGVARWLAGGYGWVPGVMGPVGRLQQALRVRRCHACWGAKLAKAAGASSRAVSLIRRHHAPGSFHDDELEALRNADEA
jgi:hypothetical protein